MLYLLNLLMRRIVLILLLLIDVALSAQKIRYVCQGCTLSIQDRTQIEIVAHFESEFFEDVFGPKKLRTVQISLCGDRKLYRRKNSPRGSVGFYSPGSKTVTVLHTTDYLSTCFHETTHALFDAYAKHRPIWINEGLATYFGYAKVDTSGNVRITAPASEKDKMRSIVQRPNFSIHYLMNISYRRFHKWRENRNYTLSWGIVYYLITQHRDVFTLILYRVGTGTDSIKAINDEYSGGIDQLEKDLALFYR